MTSFVTACASSNVTSPDAFCELYTPIKLTENDIRMLSLPAVKVIGDNNALFIKRCLK